jgi:hypothetical protein
MKIESQAIKTVTESFDGAVPHTYGLLRMGDNTKTALALHIVEALSEAGLLRQESVSFVRPVPGR